MKRCVFKSILFLSLFALVGCVGQKGELSTKNNFVKLTVDRRLVDLDKVEKVTFAVTADGQAVTEKSFIINLTDGKNDTLKNGAGEYIYEFTPDKRTNYHFVAVYDKNVSAEVLVQVISSATEHKDQFFRRSCVMKFTGTWCKYCPLMGNAIKDAEKLRPNRIIEIAVHNNDVLTVEAGDALVNLAQATALPEAMMDYREKTKTGTTTSAALLSEVDLSRSENPTVAAVKMSVKNQQGVIAIETETMVLRDGNYKLAVAVLMDGFAYPQTGAIDPNYRQNCVLRGFLSQGIYGDELGRLVAQEKKAKSYQYTLPVGTDVTRYRFVALVFNEIASGVYRVNNIIECNVDESTDYQYEQAN